jgi:hypothetical protein
MDLYTERQVRDTHSDQQASRSFFNEVSSMSLLTMACQRPAEPAAHDHQVRHTKLTDTHAKTADPHGKVADDHKLHGGVEERDKVAFASIAFCSPLMLLGLGAAFAVMDDIHSSRQHKLDSDLKNQIQWRKPDALDAQRVAALMFASRGLSSAIESFGNTNAGLSNIETLRPRSDSSIKKTGRDRKPATMLSADRSMNAVSDTRKSWTKTAKLVKEKQSLQDQLEKYRGQLSLQTVSAIVSRIEQLDKALKKLGC